MIQKPSLRWKTSIVSKALTRDMRGHNCSVRHLKTSAAAMVRGLVIG